MKTNIDQIDHHKPSFTVPDGYFENLYDRITHRIEEKKVVPFKKKIYWTVSSAAACVALIFLTFLFTRPNPEIAQQHESDDLYYQMLYMSDGIELLAEMAYTNEENLFADTSINDEEYEQIIRFLAQDNFNVIDIVNSDMSLYDSY